MPRFNGMGPEGKGSQTGRGLGKCNAEKKHMPEHIEDQAREESKGLGSGRGRKNRRRGRAS